MKIYQDSVTNWIEEVPDQWEVVKLKHVTTKIGSGVTPKGGADVYQLEGIPLLRSQNVYFDGLRLDDVARISKEIHEKMSGSKVFPGDVLLNITGASIGRCYYIPYDFEEANVNQHVCILRPNDRTSTMYLFYFLASKLGQLQIALGQTGANREGLNFEQLSNFLVPLPPLQEQTAIANFLDHKTRQIDAAIDGRRQLIELLKEHRAALINEAVTKGINPDVEMKDSGVEWIVAVPAHWGITKLRYIGTCQNGISAGGEYFGSGFPFLSYSDVYKNRTIPETPSGLVRSSEKDQERYSVEKGDVFFTRTSETIEEIGMASTCLTSIHKATFAGFLIRFRPEKGHLFDGFSKYFFRSDIQRKFFVSKMNLVTRASLGQDLLKDHPIFVIPMEEQIQIAQFLDRETSRIDTEIQAIETEIQLLKEYRQSLIAEAVTGKIDVRDYVIPEGETVSEESEG